jgi:hypothetical protein
VQVGLVLGGRVEVHLRRDPPPALPPTSDLRDWLPLHHLAWLVLDVVDQLDVDPFSRRLGELRGDRASDDT